jgi:hypothetical protein
MLEFIRENSLLLTLVAIWTLPWKGVALWKAARLKDKLWFVLILILSTLAVLEILYIFLISKRKSLLASSGVSASDGERL